MEEQTYLRKTRREKSILKFKTSQYVLEFPLLVPKIHEHESSASSDISS